MESLIAGAITGFFMVSIFKPPRRDVPSVPMPNDSRAFYTKTGCVRIVSDEIPCSASAVSLNVLVSQK